MRSIYKIFILATLITCTVFTLCAEAATSRSERARLERERAEFASFIDGFFAGAIRERNIPGLVFVAVQRGEVLCLKGYGSTEFSSALPADPERTLYRAGHISQAITATAAMQLAEKERLKLDEDVNTYLRRWSLPDLFGKPVTLRHILTHTAGFDSRAYEIYAPTSADERAYTGRLQKLLPTRSSPPGLYYSFSDMPYALIGSIIERYSRQSFAGAVKRYIFEPLMMNASSFDLSEEDIEKLAPAHDESGKKMELIYRYDMPATGLVTTAHDMGRFMLAAMNRGALGRGRVLSPIFADSMLRRHFSPHPSILGTALAYRERATLGVRTLFISGGIPGYTSFLMMIPEQNFGAFFATNVEGLVDIEEGLASALVSHLLKNQDPNLPIPTLPPRPQTDDNIQPDADGSASGWYRHNAISRHKAEKARNILGPQIHIFTDDGKLILEGNKPELARMTATPTTETDLYVARREKGRDGTVLVFFQRDEAGEIRALTMGNVGSTYEKLPWWETHPSQILQITLFSIVAIVSILGMLLAVAIGRNRLPWEKGVRPSTELWALSSLFCVLQIAFVAGLIISNLIVGAEYPSHVPYQVKGLFLLPLACGVLLAWLWLRFIPSVIDPDHHWGEKLLLFIVILCETSYMLFLANWRLLGFLF